MDPTTERRFDAIFARLGEFAGQLLELEERVMKLDAHIRARLKEEAEARKLVLHHTDEYTGEEFYTKD